jgi:hypothetical protein
MAAGRHHDAQANLRTLNQLHHRGAFHNFHPDHFPALLQHERLSLHTLASQPLCLAEPTRYFRRYLIPPSTVWLLSASSS